MHLYVYEYTDTLGEWSSNALCLSDIGERCYYCSSD